MGREAALIERARSSTGLEDFGGDGYREGLERLIRSLDGEARLNATGAAAMDAQIVSFLSQRLQVEDWYARHPEIDEQEVARPLVGVGLPRTGSSALACLLGEDPSARSLRTWESLAPCPPPTTATEHSDPRIAAAQESMDQRERLFPRMTSMLPSTATSPTECQTFMGYDFKSQIFQAFADIPSYVGWLEQEADLVPTYRYLKRILKLLQWRCAPDNWRLKNPSHILFIDAFDRVFPDARYVMTHRGVTDVIPSVCDLYLELHQAFSDSVDTIAIGRTCAGFCELGMRRMIAFRDAGREERFFDIHFAPFQRDPFPILERLYAFLGEELTPQTRARMEAWRRETPRDEGYRRTDMAEFGLEPRALQERFAFYTERFAAPATT